MTGTKVFLSCVLLAAAAAAQNSQPATTAGAAPSATQPADKASAYYHYALGHMYAELAAEYNDRSDYLNKAIDNYRAAIKDDPGATFISEELSDLYIESGRLREAVTEAQDVLKQNPNDLNARRMLARIYSRLIGDTRTNTIDQAMMQKAIEQYQKITAADPNDLDSWLMLGRLQKLAQNSEASEAAYKKVLAIDPNNEDALTGLAMVYADLGQTKEAAEVLKRAADKDPSVRSLAALSAAYEQMREYALSAETLKKALALAPDNPDLKHSLAQDLLFSQQYEAALKIYQELVQEDPHDVQSQLRISQIYRQQRKFALAEDASKKAKALDPDNIEVRYNEVELLESEGKTADAIARLKDMLDATAKSTYNPEERGNRVALLEQLGVMYRENQQYAPAVEAFRQMVTVDPDVGARSAVQIVETYRQAKNFPMAEKTAQEAAAKYPDDRMLKGVHAALLADLGKYDAAISEMRKILDQKKDRDTYINLAEICEKAKRWSDMAKALDEADKLSQDKGDKENVDFLRGAMFERQKKYEQAEAEFRKVLAMNPDSSETLNYLGFMLADRNVRLQEALDLIQRAVQREPGNYAYLDSLGWVYYRLGRYPEAEVQLKLALEKSSSDPTVHDHLGDVYFKEGKLKEAIAQWELSLKNWDQTPPADQEPAEIAKVHKKLDSARVRLAKETSSIPQEK
jgi:tetratricopeptide (TPR) repeat protein